MRWNVVTETAVSLLAWMYDGVRSVVERFSIAISNRPLSFQLRLLALATAIPLLMLAFTMFNQMVKQERDTIRQGLMTSARTLAGMVDNEIGIHAAIASTLAQSPTLQAGNLPAFLLEARKALEFVPGSWMSVAVPDGTLVATTIGPVSPPEPKHAAPELAKRAFETGRFQVSDLVLGPVSRRLAPVVAVPAFRDGVPIYSITLSLSPERLRDILEKQFSNGYVVAIIDRQSKFVARIPDHAERFGTLAAEGWRAFIAKSPEGWSENVSVEGNRILTGYTPTTHGWTVGVANLEADLAKPLSRVLWQIALAGSLLLLASLSIAWWLSERAGRTMTSLARAARALGEGRQLPVDKLSFDEARTIATALRTASEELHERGARLASANLRLESEVAERTRELTAEMKRREATEFTLRQSQKMEAIGQLTGGIAHDFNNMLTIVIGNLDTLRRRLQSLDPIQTATLSRPVEAAMQGARNAAKLTHRLLAFARQQPLAPTSVDMRGLVAGMSDMLVRTVGETIQIESVSGAGLWPTLADANQLENVLINLVVNARDAMPGGGKITIETSNAYLDEIYVADVGDILEGQYVMLSVSDTGAGIKADQLEKVFEPFYTTKPPGEGTGLGLAMIHGFVKQSGGHIRIYSEVGQGTTVKIYLPRLQSNTVIISDSAHIDRPMPQAVAGETILLVEDDDGVREYAVSALEDLGYRVVAVATAKEALRALAETDRVDLLFTDVVLSGGVNGRVLADEIGKLRPDLPVLFTTGYTRNAIVHHGRLDRDVHLLGKPYTSRELSEKVRVLIDG